MPPVVYAVSWVAAPLGSAPWPQIQRDNDDKQPKAHPKQEQHVSQT
jgi:hypothetical protein